MSNKVDLNQLFPPPPEPPAATDLEATNGPLIHFMSISNLPAVFDMDRLMDGIEAQMSHFMPHLKYTLAKTTAHLTAPPSKIISIALRQPADIHRLMDVFEEPIMREFNETGINPQTLARPFEFRLDTNWDEYKKVKENRHLRGPDLQP